MRIKWRRQFFLFLMGISAAGAVAGGVAAFTQPKAPVAPTQTQTSSQQAKAEQAAAMAQAQALQRRRGLSSTILTSPLGVGGGERTTQATLGA